MNMYKYPVVFPQRKDSSLSPSRNITKKTILEPPLRPVTLHW